jgi:hypothetical protein
MFHPSLAQKPDQTPVYSVPLWSERDHDLVALFSTLGFECECLLLPAHIELDDPSCNINHGPNDTQEWPPKNKWHLTTDIHLEYHEVHGYERIPDSQWDIFRNSYWTPDRLICQLQMHGSRDFALGLAIDFPDRVITAFTFSVMGTTS